MKRVTDSNGCSATATCGCANNSSGRANDVAAAMPARPPVILVMTLSLLASKVSVPAGKYTGIPITIAFSKPAQRRGYREVESVSVTRVAWLSE